MKEIDLYLFLYLLIIYFVSLNKYQDKYIYALVDHLIATSVKHL